jgi:hypothetical protein
MGIRLTGRGETAGTLVSGDLTLPTDIVGGEDISTAAGLLAALNGGEYASIAATAGAGTYTFVTAASGDANFDSVTLIGVVNSSTTFSSLVAANFS